jgi:hypothetical protein
LKQRIDHPRECEFPDCPICSIEAKTRNKREISRTIKDNLNKSNKRKDNSSKENLTEENIREQLRTPSFYKSMCDKYNLITSDLYMDSIDEYLDWVVKHKFFKKDHQRDFEGRLMGKQDELEKKR